MKSMKRRRLPWRSNTAAASEALRFDPGAAWPAKPSDHVAVCSVPP
jgi:hypothetical protein